MQNKDGWRVIKLMFKLGFYFTLIFICLHTFNMVTQQLRDYGTLKTVYEYNRYIGPPAELEEKAKDFSLFRQYSGIALLFLACFMFADYMHNPDEHFFKKVKLAFDKIEIKNEEIDNKDRD